MAVDCFQTDVVNIECATCDKVLILEGRAHDCSAPFETIVHDSLENTLKDFDLRAPGAAEKLTPSQWDKFPWVKVDADNLQQAAEMSLADWMRSDEEDCEFGPCDYVVYVRDRSGRIFRSTVCMNKTVLYEWVEDEVIQGSVK